MAKGGGVSREKRCEGREKWEMKRKKEKKHAEKRKKKLRNQVNHKLKLARMCLYVSLNHGALLVASSLGHVFFFF